MVWLLLIILVLLFGFVVLFGAPYLPTQKRQIEAALELLNLKKGQTLLELGCGDGRVLKAAAKQGIRGVGYEINPVLVIAAKLYTYNYRDTVSIKWGNYWTATWPEAEGVYVFLLDKYMKKLEKKLLKEKAGWSVSSIKLASYTFKMPGKKPSKEAHGIFLYEYK
jgi:hypothetical protein